MEVSSFTTRSDVDDIDINIDYTRRTVDVWTSSIACES